MSVAPAWLGLRAALLLARGRAEGVVLVAAASPDGQIARARRSFAALSLCLPVFLAVQTLGPARADDAVLRALAGLVLSWLGYAVLSFHLATGMGRATLWPRFIALWNWCNLVQYLLLSVAALPPLLGVPVLAAQTAWLVALGWAVWLQWTATRLGLGLSGGRAGMMVAADMALGLLVLQLIG
jgi:hypothetical protein